MGPRRGARYAPATSPDLTQRPLATVSIDVDPLDVHLAGYGFADAAPDTSVYQRSIPRLLSLLGDARIRATFFFVARDLPAAAPAVAAVVAAGHEAASHSLTHPLPFRKLGKEAFTRELVESKRRIEEAARAPVVGFRAPNWDLTARELPALAEAGYLYDASSYPSPYLFLARAWVAMKGTGPRAFLQLTKLPVSWARGPRRVRWPGGALAEFPVSTAASARFPIYQTLLHGLPPERIGRMLAYASIDGEGLSFALHALDALGVAEDGLDPRLARHPGMRKPLDRKLGSLGSTFAAISSYFEAIPFRERLGREPALAADGSRGAIAQGR